MPKKLKPEPDDREQSKRFVDTARTLVVDESGEVFEKALRVVTKQPKKDATPCLNRTKGGPLQR